MPQTITIRNAGFDPPFPYQDKDGHLKVAESWWLAWVEGPEAYKGFLVRPECYPKVLYDVSGTVVDYCQGIQTTSATHRAAFIQTVDLPARAKNLSLEARVAYHAPGGGMAVRVGLDGTGQTTNIDAPTIHWGNWLNQEGDPPWRGETYTVAKAVLAEAISGYVSIWLLSQNKWRGRNNHVFWRDVSLMAEGDAEPGPDPDPGTAAGLIMNAVDLLLDAVAKL